MKTVWLAIAVDIEAESVLMTCVHDDRSECLRQSRQRAPDHLHHFAFAANADLGREIDRKLAALGIDPQQRTAIIRQIGETWSEHLTDRPSTPPGD